MSLKTLLGKKGFTLHTVSPDLPVVDAILRMAEARIRGMVVVDSGRPAGILLESDIVKSCATNGGRGLEALRVVDVMTADPMVADVGDDVGPRLDAMLQSGIECLPVVDDGKTLGVLYLRDLLEHRIEGLMEELGMLHDYVASLQEAIQD